MVQNMQEAVLKRVQRRNFCPMSPFRWRIWQHKCQKHQSQQCQYQQHQRQHPQRHRSLTVQVCPGFAQRQPATVPTKDCPMRSHDWERSETAQGRQRLRPAMQRQPTTSGMTCRAKHPNRRMLSRQPQRMASPLPDALPQQPRKVQPQSRPRGLPAQVP